MHQAPAGAGAPSKLRLGGQPQPPTHHRVISKEGLRRPATPGSRRERRKIAQGASPGKAFDLSAVNSPSTKVPTIPLHRIPTRPAPIADHFSVCATIISANRRRTRHAQRMNSRRAALRRNKAKSPQMIFPGAFSREIIRFLNFSRPCFRSLAHVAEPKNRRLQSAIRLKTQSPRHAFPDPGSLVPVPSASDPTPYTPQSGL